jgi:hypothetical protein
MEIQQIPSPPGEYPFFVFWFFHVMTRVFLTVKHCHPCVLAKSYQFHYQESSTQNVAVRCRREGENELIFP